MKLGSSPTSPSITVLKRPSTPVKQPLVRSVAKLSLVRTSRVQVSEGSSQTLPLLLLVVFALSISASLWNTLNASALTANCDSYRELYTH